MSERSSPTKYFISGGIGGVCLVLSGYPMDTIKVRLQTMSILDAGKSPLYRGTWDCFRSIVKTEGFRGLYKGMVVSLTGIAPIYAVSFMGFSVGKNLVGVSSTEPLTKWQVFVAGAFSGVVSTAVAVPCERIKCLLQVQTGTEKYKGMVDCARKLYLEGGARSLFKGSAATLLRDVHSSGVYFLVYDYLRQNLIKKDTSAQKSVLATIFAGGCAGISYWLTNIPVDVLKTRLQSAPEGTYPNGMRDVFKQLMKHEGPRALFKGVTPVLLKEFPANAACFLGFEACILLLDYIAPNL